MKTALLITMVALVMLIGMAWVLAYFQVIPAQRMADKTPMLRPILVGLRVAKAPAKKKPKPSSTAKASTPAPLSRAAEQASLAAEKEALATEKEQVDAEKAVLDKKLASAAAPTDLAGGAPAEQAADPKVISIYSTMKADQLAAIFAKLPDSAVAEALEQLDDRQAGKVLAALPNDRAAKLTVLMGHLKPPAVSGPPTAMTQ